MGVSLARTPARIKIRVWKHDNRHYVLKRDGEGWESIADFDDKNDALECIEQHFADKDAQWSLDVKIRDGWCCQHPGCGELDKNLLESHHIKPKEKFPELRNDLENGQCLCIYHHALKHNSWIRLLIMARGFLILLGRLYPNKKAEISRITL